MTETKETNGLKKQLDEAVNYYEDLQKELTRATNLVRNLETALLKQMGKVELLDSMLKPKDEPIKPEVKK